MGLASKPDADTSSLSSAPPRSLRIELGVVTDHRRERPPTCSQQDTCSGKTVPQLSGPLLPPDSPPARPPAAGIGKGSVALWYYYCSGCSWYYTHSFTAPIRNPAPGARAMALSPGF